MKGTILLLLLSKYRISRVTKNVNIKTRFLTICRKFKQYSEFNRINTRNANPMNIFNSMLLRKVINWANRKNYGNTISTMNWYCCIKYRYQINEHIKDIYYKRTGKSIEAGCTKKKKKKIWDNKRIKKIAKNTKNT